MTCLGDCWWNRYNTCCSNTYQALTVVTDLYCDETATEAYITVKTIFLNSCGFLTSISDDYEDEPLGGYHDDCFCCNQ